MGVWRYRWSSVDHLHSELFLLLKSPILSITKECWFTRDGCVQHFISQSNAELSSSCLVILSLSRFTITPEIVFPQSRRSLSKVFHYECKGQIRCFGIFVLPVVHLCFILLFPTLSAAVACSFLNTSISLYEGSVLGGGEARLHFSWFYFDLGTLFFRKDNEFWQGSKFFRYPRYSNIILVMFLNA